MAARTLLFIDLYWAKLNGINHFQDLFKSLVKHEGAAEILPSAADVLKVMKNTEI